MKNLASLVGLDMIITDNLEVAYFLGHRSCRPVVRKNRHERRVIASIMGHGSPVIV